MLTEIQLFVIATAASIIVWLLKLTKSNLSAGWLTIAVYAVSFGLAFLFTPVVLPPLPPFVDTATFVPALLAWFGDLLPVLSAFVGFATLIYNVLLKAVLEKYIRPLLMNWRAK
jgi:hypothetical protein